MFCSTVDQRPRFRCSAACYGRRRGVPQAYLTVRRPLHLGSIVTGHWGLDLSNMLWPIAARIGLQTSTAPTCLVVFSRRPGSSTMRAARLWLVSDSRVITCFLVPPIWNLFCYYIVLLFFPRTLKFVTDVARVLCGDVLGTL